MLRQTMDVLGDSYVAVLYQAVGPGAAAAAGAFHLVNGARARRLERNPLNAYS